MNILIQRKILTDKSSIGPMTIDDCDFCFALEDTDRRLEDGGEKIPGETAIPRGKYNVTITHSPRFGCDMPLIHDVPGFEGVRIHWGNKPEDTEGCILVGDSYADDWISASRATYAKLFNKIEAALLSEDTVTLEVV